MDACRRLLSELQESLVDLSPELTPTHERLVSILRSIAAANTRSKVIWLGCRLALDTKNIAVPASRTRRFSQSVKRNQDVHEGWQISR